MREIILYQGGHPFKNDNLKHMSDGFKEALMALVQGIDTNKNFVLDGCQITTVGPNTLISAGYVVLNGEIYQVKPQSITTVSGTLHFIIKQYALTPDVPTLNVEEPSPSQLVNPNYGQLYQDNLRKDVHIERRAEIKFNAVNGDSATGTIYDSSTIPTLKQIRDALDRAAYKNEENIFTKTQTHSKGTYDTLDMTISSETHKHLRLKNDGNFYVYAPSSNVIISRINLVDGLIPTISSPNISSNNGTEIVIHVINNSVRLIDYSLHSSGTYSTGGGIFIPESMGSKEIFVPTGSTIILRRSDDYSSSYEYILIGVSSNDYGITSDLITNRYTQIGEIELNAINENKFSIIEVSDQGKYTKLFFQLTTGASFATNATGVCEIIESNSLNTNNFIFRLEVKNSTQQIGRLYLYSPSTTIPLKFRIRKILNSGLLNKSPQILSLKTVTSSLTSPLLSYTTTKNNYYNTILVQPTDIRKQDTIDIVEKSSPSVPGRLEYELAIKDLKISTFFNSLIDDENIPPSAQIIISSFTTPNDGINRAWLFSFNSLFWSEFNAAPFLTTARVIMRYNYDVAHGSSEFNDRILEAVVGNGNDRQDGFCVSANAIKILPPNTLVSWVVWNLSGTVGLNYDNSTFTAMGIFESYE